MVAVVIPMLLSLIVCYYLFATALLAMMLAVMACREAWRERSARVPTARVVRR